MTVFLVVTHTKTLETLLVCSNQHLSHQIWIVQHMRYLWISLQYTHAYASDSCPH